MLSFSSSCLRVEGQLSTACSIPVRADSSCCVTSSPFLSCRQIELLGRWEPLLAALLCGQTSSMSHCARDDVTLPPQGGWHHLPDALAPFVQHKLSVILCWSMCGPWRKWGEGTASWQGCKVLQTRAVPERQWCNGCASQHWYYPSHSCYSHSMQEHVCNTFTCILTLPLHGKWVKGKRERAFRSLQEVLPPFSAKPQEKSLYSMYVRTVGITLIYLISTAQMSNGINMNP